MASLLSLQALLVADSGDVVGEQPLFELLLLEERLHRVANIENAERFPIDAEHRYVLKAVCRHGLPD